ncbi:MAG: Transcriptional regulator, LuxR family protein [Myxococcales bacterium]|nr:Transcriptional regulator, LuxR family protein [Myxococcales bacterium]
MRVSEGVGDGFIRIERVRAAVRLVGEVRELGATTEAGRHHMVEQLLGLVGCAVGGAVHDTGYGLGLKGGIAEATLVGFDREIIDLFQAHHTHGSDFNPYHDAVMRRSDVLAGGVFTSTNRDLVPRADWEGSEWINEYARPARVDHFLCSMQIVGTTSGIGCGFMRAARDRPFSDEDREVLHLVHLGVGAFYDVSSPRRRLTPRMRDTLDVMLTGASDKEIAARLDISPHTVRQYVKAILRAHGVSSRTQLIAAAKRT